MIHGERRNIQRCNARIRMNAQIALLDSLAREKLGESTSVKEGRVTERDARRPSVKDCSSDRKIG
ncbi:hypothetical protein PUN28_018823 [Cardiocondyla obscurior]|uniref:Uncharacterized protein n=1 Tax=Cardiocondyla obscurior TaxID=286306 RepID=A0AAW2EFY2_9HYME